MAERTILIGSGTARTGEAVITAFLGAGYRVAATSRKRDQLDQTLRRVSQDNSVLSIEADLSKPEDANEAVRQTCAAFGRLDAATLLSGSFDQREVTETTLTDLQHQVEANLYTSYNLVRAALPVMLTQGHGHLITIAGGSGIDPAPGRALFGASKAAVITFTKGVARDYKQRGIVPTCLVAGAIATEEAREYLDAEDFQNAVTLDEFANALVFLASAGGNGLCGQYLGALRPRGGLANRCERPLVVGTMVQRGTIAIGARRPNYGSSRTGRCTRRPEGSHRPRVGRQHR